MARITTTREITGNVFRVGFIKKGKLLVSIKTTANCIEHLEWPEKLKSFQKMIASSLINQSKILKVKYCQLNNQIEDCKYEYHSNESPELC